MSRVHAAIKNKFSSGEEHYPVVLTGVGKEAKVLLYLLVGAFGLAVGLGVVSSSESMCDAKLVVEGFH